MILRSDVLARIRDGGVTLAFRRWRRATVRSDGTLMTSIGKLRIASVRSIPESAITPEDARRAGYSSREELLDDLNRRDAGAVYRIEFGGIAPDPRIRLRESLPDDAELTEILRQLERMDRGSVAGAWTAVVLRLVASEPGVLAETLAHRIGMEKHPFKARVRRLKALGLTVSLATGYRLSPRGEAVLARLTRRARPRG
jgi:hypothetical protein